LFGLAAVLFFTSVPPFQLVLPVDRAMLLLAPALAACAIAGWRNGGRLSLAVAWTTIAVWILWMAAARGGSFALLVVGWSVLVAALFGAVLVVGWGERYLSRALLAIGMALAVGAFTAVMAGRGGFETLLNFYAEETAGRVAVLRTAWTEFTSTPQWAEMVAGTPNAARLTEGMELQFTLLPRLARLLLPALLALETLIVLALGWALYHRFGRARVGPPLADWRDLTFHDAFVWGVIAGLVVIVVPVPGIVHAAGMNLLVFTGVLYALRGLGVMLWFLAPGRWMQVFLAIVLVLFPHIIGIVAAVLGVGDTWLDWRRRPRPTTQRSE
jgi:uncharacterized protein YybS (DUF2232 family)